MPPTVKKGQIIFSCKGRLVNLGWGRWRAFTNHVLGQLDLWKRRGDRLYVLATEASGKMSAYPLRFDHHEIWF